jgi:hypothetical protein
MKIKTEITVIFALTLISFFCRTAMAEPLRADAVVEKDRVFSGEAFIFQIQVSGSENPEKPDLSGISDFSVEYRGGQQNSSSSVSIINGHITRNVRKRYVFSYQLIPKRTGRLIIPSITVNADHRSTQTSSLNINVQKPAETDNFKLRLGLSKKHCYVGEPVTLTVTWYLGDDVRGFSMNLPLLEKKDLFHFIDPEVDISSGGKFYRIPLSGGEVIGEKGQKRLGDRNYATITFRKILIPQKPGYVTIEPATVVCEVLSGYRRGRSPFSNDFLSDFLNDDFFGNGRQGVYRKVAVPSNRLDLKVSEVPDDGKPANFAGHVGEYKIKTEAVPTEISVGDPITLKLTLSGPDYLEHVTLPPLNQQAALKRDFRIPKERAVGETSGKAKVFTQTIRPLRPGIKKIPSIELPYFDTKTGTYKVARTDPIPVTVKSARVVTAMDAEGMAQPVLSTNEVETWTKGIAYNYEDMSVIENQRFGLVAWLESPVVFCMTVIPPIVYLVLLFGNICMTRLYADPLASRARKAHGRLKAGLKDARHAQSNKQCCDKILDAFRQYLGDKLRIPGGALTFNDVRKSLEERGIDAGTIKRLKELFDRCEAGRYAGGSGEFDTSILIEQSLSLAKLLEKKL